MWKCRWAESKLSGYHPISVHLRFVFIHLCFPGRVLTRNRRAAVDCCDERNTVWLQDRNISGVSRQFSLFQARLNLVFYYLCTFDHKGFRVLPWKTLKSKVWICFVNTLLHCVFTSNPWFDDPVHFTATRVCKCVLSVHLCALQVHACVLCVRGYPILKVQLLLSPVSPNFFLFSPPQLTATTATSRNRHLKPSSHETASPQRLN